MFIAPSQDPEADRVDLVTKARLLHPSIDHRGVDSRTLMERAILAHQPTIKLAGKSDEYVQALLDFFAKDVRDKQVIESKEEKIADAKRGDAADRVVRFDAGYIDPIERARQIMIERTANAWKKPGAAEPSTELRTDEQERQRQNEHNRTAWLGDAAKPATTSNDPDASRSAFVDKLRDDWKR